MRRVYALVLAVPFVVTLVATQLGPPAAALEQEASAPIALVSAHTPALAGPQEQRGIDAGRQIFRYDTFGDEQLWTDVLRMHEVVANVPPATALAVGLKVDVDALPPAVIEALQAGQVDLTNPAVTVELLRLNAVVGVQGKVDDLGQLTSVGITCALCHSSVDDSFTKGIGRGDRRPVTRAR
jgi:hypothetical protein